MWGNSITTQRNRQKANNYVEKSNCCVICHELLNVRECECGRDSTNIHRHSRGDKIARNLCECAVGTPLGHECIVTKLTL